jgi:hypothetical protein
MDLDSIEGLSIEEARKLLKTFMDNSDSFVGTSEHIDCEIGLIEELVQEVFNSAFKAGLIGGWLTRNSETPENNEGEEWKQ